MTPELIAQVLALPTAVQDELKRIGRAEHHPGWEMGISAWSGTPLAVVRESVECVDASTFRAGEVRAWLPCNPLAIVEHARVSARATTAGINLSFGGSQYAWFRHADGREQEFRGSSVYVCAVALLREVVG